MTGSTPLGLADEFESELKNRDEPFVRYHLLETRCLILDEVYCDTTIIAQ